MALGRPAERPNGQQESSLVDGGAVDLAVKVHEGGEVLQLLAHHKAQSRQHGDAAVRDLEWVGGCRAAAFQSVGCAGAPAVVAYGVTAPTYQAVDGPGSITHQPPHNNSHSHQIIHLSPIAHLRLAPALDIRGLGSAGEASGVEHCN